MAMNKQRKMLIGVLLLGIGGLGVDRFVIGTPDAAAADGAGLSDQSPADAEPIVAEVVASETDQPVGEALPSYASLTERLIEAQQQHTPEDRADEHNDPFALPAKWQSDKSNPRVTAGQGSTGKRVNITKLFRLDATVRSVIQGKEEMLAVISGAGLDGRAIRIGQQVKIPNGDGSYESYELVEVGSRYVVWEILRTGQRVVMKVEEVL